MVGDDRRGGGGGDDDDSSDDDLPVAAAATAAAATFWQPRLEIKSLKIDSAIVGLEAGEGTLPTTEGGL